MPATLGVRVLLVSSDIQTIDILCHSMEKMAMHVEVCPDIASATRKLCHSKFEAVAVDFKESAEALDLLKKLRHMTSHKSAVVLAILDDNDQMPIAFRGGASFVVVRPLSQAALQRTLRVSYPLMVHEKRRNLRCPLQIPIYISMGFRPESRLTSVNISEGGMALADAPALQVGERVALRMTLPGTQAVSKISAEVCWSDNAGRVGVEFVQVPSLVREQLISWLAHRLDESLREEIVPRS
jgi:CheY-like chemotaxis protein